MSTLIVFVVREGNQLICAVQNTEFIGTISQVNDFVGSVDSDVGTFSNASPVDFLSEPILTYLNTLVNFTVSKEQRILRALSHTETG